MDLSSLLVAFIGGGAASTLIHWILNRRNKTADTYLKLSTTVKNLADDITRIRAAWEDDKLAFQQELLTIQRDYKKRIKALEARVKELEEERQILILENHELRQELKHHPP